MTRDVHGGRKGGVSGGPGPCWWGWLQKEEEQEAGHGLLLTGWQTFSRKNATKRDTTTVNAVWRHMHLTNIEMTRLIHRNIWRHFRSFFFLLLSWEFLVFSAFASMHRDADGRWSENQQTCRCRGVASVLDGDLQCGEATRGIKWGKERAVWKRQTTEMQRERERKREMAASEERLKNCFYIRQYSCNVLPCDIRSSFHCAASSAVCDIQEMGKRSTSVRFFGRLQ